MITTTLTNVGAPFLDAKGGTKDGVAVKFTLVNRAMKPTHAFDAISGECISSQTVTVITSGGEFSVALWPTSRAAETVFYLCEVSDGTIKEFIAPLDETTTVTWLEFRAAGATLSATGLSLFTSHTADTDLHITAVERSALSATPNTPSSSNPFATILDVQIAGGAVPATDVVAGVGRLSVAAASALDPIMVGDNDPRMLTTASATACNLITESGGAPLWDGGAWPGGSGSGHVIIAPNGDSMAQRSKLKFVYATGTSSGVAVTDDAGNDQTIVTITFPTVIDGGTWT